MSRSLVYTQQSSLVTFLSLTFLGIKGLSNQSQSSIVLEPLTRHKKKTTLRNVTFLIVFTEWNDHIWSMGTTRALCLFFRQTERLRAVHLYVVCQQAF